MALPVRSFVIQRLLEFDPNFDVGSGVPTTGLMVDPLSIILQPVVDELSVAQASQSILTILESSDPDNFPEDIVDGLASNAFVERNPGFIGSDVQRIRFFSPVVFSAKKGVLIFRGSGGQRYTNSEAVAITSAEMALNQDGTLYFVDIPIVALEEGSAYNVPKGAITTMEAEPVGVANVTNLFGMEQGRDRETNTELIDRIKVAVTVRALVTGRGIIVTLTENFTTIEEIQPIGFGQPEMMRDIVYNVHIGGNVDVYIKSAAFSTGEKDVFGLEIDTTRRRRGSSVLALVLPDTGYSVGRSSIDRTEFVPTVKSLDGVTYAEGIDYTLDDATGLIARPSGTSTILHLAITAAAVTGLKEITKVAAFPTSVKAGMTVTIDTPGSVAGTYTIKERVSANVITVYGEFPVASASNVDFAIDDNVLVTFDYNPVTIDVIRAARSTDREPFTITDVPLMYIESIEVLDPLSGEPTGEVLDGKGGYGAGGYGMGGYGIGAGIDYAFQVFIPTLRHSWREDNYIEFSDLLVGISVRVNYKYASAIPPIQAFMDDRNNQSETASLLARHFIPVFVDTTKGIVYDIPVDAAATAITVDDMTDLVKAEIEAVDEGRALEVSDIIDLLYNNGAERVDIDSVKSLRGEIHNHDGSVVFTLPDAAGDLAIPDDPIPDPTDKPLSPRIARFRARDISITRNVG
jgi:hypothetical protein